MQTFITEITKEDGKYVGPEISALSWIEAETLAQQQGVILVGVLED